jgi:hypothetical protein
LQMKYSAIKTFNKAILSSAIRVRVKLFNLTLTLRDPHEINEHQHTPSEILV